MRAALPGLLLALLVPATCAFPEEPSTAGPSSISFANDVAPVLVDQCLVCHNTRTARGRFSVETFAALMKGGETGAAVEPGEEDLSNLVLLIESGEMPKEGDPLTTEQMANIRRWIAEGAKLDDGKPADRPLSSIMPRRPHPKPPANYAHPVPVTAVAFHRDGNVLAVPGYHEVLLFDPGDGRLLRRIADVAERVHGLAFSPDGELLAVASGTPARTGEVKLFQSATGEQVADLVTAADGFFDVAFSPDGTRLAAAGADRTARVWNVADHAEVARIEDHADWVTGVAFSPDGNRLATSSRDKTAKVFDLASGGTVVTFIEHGRPVNDVQFSADGRQVLTCGKDGQIRIWNAEDGKQLKKLGTGGDGLSIARLGSERFLCGSRDRSVRLFAIDGKEQKIHREHPDWVAAVGTSADGRLVAVGTLDGTVTLRDGKSGEVLRTLSAMPTAH